ncbi:MAG: glycosyltransferase [Gemmatimonadota bacterium]
MAPTVSVIIPCYEHAEYLAEALESTALQGPHVDTIVVDDGSTTDIRRVTDAFPSVRYVRQEHAGVSAARNTGLATQDSPFVLFLDADDRLLPGAIDAGLRAFERHPEAGFVFGAYRFIKRSGDVAGRPGLVVPSSPDYLSLVRGNYIGTPAVVLFRTGPVMETGGFDADLQVSEDYELTLRVARTHSIRFHDTLVAEYRRYDTSASADASRMLRTVVHVLERERSRAPEGLRDHPAFEEGLEFFKLFYGVRVVRQMMREVVLRGRIGDAISRWGELRNILGPRLVTTKLPPAVAVSAYRKVGYIIRGWMG